MSDISLFAVGGLAGIILGIILAIIWVKLKLRRLRKKVPIQLTERGNVNLNGIHEKEGQQVSSTAINRPVVNATATSPSSIAASPSREAGQQQGAVLEAGERKLEDAARASEHGEQLERRGEVSVSTASTVRKDKPKFKLYRPVDI